MTDPVVSPEKSKSSLMSGLGAAQTPTSIVSSAPGLLAAGKSQPLTQAGDELSMAASKSQAQTETDLQASKTRGLEREAGATQDYVKSASGLQDKLTGSSEKTHAFEPTHDNSKDLLTMFSVMSILQTAMGGKGKYAAMRANASLTGAMDGYKKGRKDLFNQEIKEYDKYVAQVKEHNDQAQKEYDRAMDLLSKNKEAGFSAFRAMASKEADGIMSTAAQAGDWKRVGEILRVRGEAIKKSEEAKASAEQKFSNEKQLKAIEHKNRMLEIGARGENKAAGGAAAGAIERMAQASTQATDALENLARLPVSTTDPVFGQTQFKSLLNAPLSVLNQTLSSDSSQKLQTRMAGVARNLASLETGGAATGLAKLAEKIDAGVAIPAGASMVVALDKLAEMRRIVESAARTSLSSSKYTKEQKDLIQGNLESVRRSIPFTQADLDNAEIATDNEPSSANMSFTDFVNKNKKQLTESTGLSAEKEARYQELLRKRQNASK